MIEYRKVKDLRKGPKGMLKTPKQIEASRKSGLKTCLTKNPMWNPVVVEKIKRKSKESFEKRMQNPDYRRVLFQPGNKFGTLRRNRKISEEQKLAQSLKMTGKKCNPKSREHLIRMLILNGPPMKNPEIARKNGEARRLKLPKEILEAVTKTFLDGSSITKLAEELKIDSRTFSKILKRNEIKFARGERISIYNRMNPNIKKNQFKKGEKHGIQFKKGYKHTEEEKEIRRRKDISNNTKEIIGLYSQHVSASKIAKQFNTTHNTILSLLRRNGVEVRPQREYILGNKNPSRIFYNKKCKEVENEENNIIIVPANPAIICN